MPIDIASGTVSLEFDGIKIPGRIPLTFQPRYSTGLIGEVRSPIGLGWFDLPFCSLRQIESGFVFTTSTGAKERFEDPHAHVAKGGVVRNLGAYLEIFQDVNRYVIRSWDVAADDVKHLCFDRVAHGVELPLTSVEDVSGDGIDLIWEPSALTSRLVTIRQRIERRELRIAYDGAGWIDHVDLWTAREGTRRVFTYEHDAAGHLTSIIDAAGFADRFEYDAESRVVREIDRDGAVLRYVYDSVGRCVLHSGLGRYQERRLRYMPAIGMTELTNSYGNTTTYRYLPSGQIVLEVNSSGAQRATDYDEHGRILGETDANGATTRYAYDDRGNRELVVDPLGNSTRVSFNEYHQPTEMIDAAGGRWQRAYDDAGHLVATSDALGSRYSYRFDAHGNLVEVQNPLGAVRRLTYNDGVLRTATDWMGHETQFRFDAYGQVTFQREPVGDVTEVLYDALGNPTQVRLPNGAAVHATYDAGDNLTSFTDVDGRVTRLTYGPCGRLLERIDALGHTVRYFWGTEAGALDAIVNEKGETHTFERDGSGRVVAEVSFAGVRREYRLDGEGRLRVYTDGLGQTVEIDRDLMGRIVAARLPDGEQLQYAFDPLGELVEAISADIAVAYERDALGRVVRESQGTRWLRTTYDAAGGVLGLDTSEGLAVEHQVNPNSRIISSEAFDQTIHFTLDANGQEIGRILPGGARLKQSYDVMGQMRAQSVTTPPVLPGGAARQTVDRQYDYARDGSLLRAIDGRWGRVDYVYDGVDRLLAALRNRGRSEHFQYDATGNISRAQAEGDRPRDDVFEYATGDQLVQQGRVRFEHDAESRCVARIEERLGQEPAVWRYEWNALGRLKGVVRPDGQVWRYRYDALARRVAKVCDGAVAAEYLWDRDVIVQELLPNAPSRSWLWEEGRFAPVATVQTGRLFTVVTDPAGTPRELVSGVGAVVRTVLLDAWGGLAATERDPAAPVCDIRFQGQWADAESGLHYNFYRYYDPSGGRYISDDPIGLEGGLNAFTYAPNPIRWVDPLGLCNGNSGRARREQHGYVIIDTKPKGGGPPRIVKVGVSGQPQNSNGSPRANNQANRWNREPGNAGRYQAQVATTVPAGPGARQKVLAWETQTANTNRATLDPQRHKRP